MINNDASPQRVYAENETHNSPEALVPADTYHKIVVDGNDGSNAPELAFPDKQTFPSDKKFNEAPIPVANEERRVCGFRRKVVIIILVIVVVVVAAAVGAGVGASVKSNKNSNSSSPNDSKNPSSGQNPDAILVTTEDSQDVPRTGLSGDSSLAVAEWQDPSGATHYRVYFQTPENSIMQTAWDSDTKTWRVSRVTIADDAKAGTAVAALPGFKFMSKERQVNLYYSSRDNRIIELLGNPDDTVSWAVGAMTDMKWRLVDSSRIAVSRLPGLIYFQDAGDLAVHAANFTANPTWAKYPLPNGPLPPGTDITSVGHGEVIPGVTVFFCEDNTAEAFTAGPPVDPSFRNASWSVGDEPKSSAWDTGARFPSVRRRSILSPRGHSRPDKRASGRGAGRLVGMPLKAPVADKKPNDANLIFLGDERDNSVLAMRRNSAKEWGPSRLFTSQNYRGRKAYRNAAAAYNGHLFALFVDEAGPGIEHWKTEDRGDTWKVIGLVRTDA